MLYYRQKHSCLLSSQANNYCMTIDVLEGYSHDVSESISWRLFPCAELLDVFSYVLHNIRLVSDTVKFAVHCILFTFNPCVSSLTSTSSVWPETGEWRSSINQLRAMVSWSIIHHTSYRTNHKPFYIELILAHKSIIKVLFIFSPLAAFMV